MSMDAAHPLYVVFLWHMHQPYYRDRLTGECLLPWTRLHGLKNYYDIPAIGAEFPTIHQTFNLVPSLMAQVEEYAVQGRSDAFLDVTQKPAEDLNMQERLFILRNFFLANTDTMINPYARYRQLLDKRGLYGDLDDVAQTREWFTTQDFLDLQVWFHLTWSGHTLRYIPEVRALFDKGRHFTEKDKRRLLDIQHTFLSGILPEYRRLQEAGQIEVSVSPFYHPILPLLCDTNEARVAVPDMALPSRRFAHPEDAAAQIRNGIAFYTERFGRAPRGMWPSEGSVSPAMLPFVAEAGIQWMATDDAILACSLTGGRNPQDRIPDLTAAQRYRPYRLTGAPSVALLFRDHLLSDRIGFVYSRWNAEDAARDLVNRLLDIRRQAPPSEPVVAPIILDGENAWEYYTNHGRDFLRMVYTLISERSDIRTVTVSEAVEQAPARSLERLFSGSWIENSFSTWIGHEEKNAGWTCLAEARQQLVAREKDADPDSAGQLRDAWESLYIAEGSDWFWWYGDDHSSMNDAEFDQLFRTHTGNVYRALGLPVPDRLLRPIRQQHILRPVRLPMGRVTPDLDGRATSYYEWLRAGYYDIKGGRGSMHQAETFLKRVHFGFDAANLYLRIDTAAPMTDETCRDYRLSIQFRKPKPRYLMIIREGEGDYTLYLDERERTQVPARARVSRLIECAFPLDYLQAKPHDILEFELTLYQDGLELERWPNDGIIEMAVPDPEEYDEWIV